MPMLFAAVLAASMVTPQPSPSPVPTAAPERWSLHAQSTVVQQYHQGFPAAYSGAQSLYDQPDWQRTFDVTLYLGARLWKGAEFYFDSELDQGFGLGNPGPPGSEYDGTTGVAGYLSGEAYKLGSATSYARVQQTFARQTFDLGGAWEAIEPDNDQLGGSVTTRHITLTAGKFSVTNVFDTNPYAHDPRDDFLNWAIIDMGAFDYASDAWGYTYGISAELVQQSSTIRLGIFQLSQSPDDVAIEHQPLLQYSPIVEYERRTSLFGGHPGSIKALVYYDEGFFGPYADAVDAARGTGHPPSTADVRSKHLKAGGGLNLAQEIAPHVGLFARLSAMNGTYEADAASDIDRSFSGGFSVDGGLYSRPYDTFGIAWAANAISGPAQEYFGAGGLGIVIGDGALSYSAEQIMEMYYKVGITPYGAVTVDYQHISNPGYNTVRGPISVFGLRYHLNY